MIRLNVPLKKQVVPQLRQSETKSRKVFDPVIFCEPLSTFSGRIRLFDDNDNGRRTMNFSEPL
jgi:hypothetical protein